MLRDALVIQSHLHLPCEVRHPCHLVMQSIWFNGGNGFLCQCMTFHDIVVIIYSQLSERNGNNGSPAKFVTFPNMKFRKQYLTATGLGTSGLLTVTPIISS